MSIPPKARAALRSIPSVDEILTVILSECDNTPYPLILQTVKQSLSKIRDVIKSGNHIEDVESLTLEMVRNDIAHVTTSSIKNVINGTGIILHTGLGRAPISGDILKTVASKLTGYVNLEFDIYSGSRGERIHHVETLLKALTGCDSALLVNNNAAAVLLMLNSVADKRDVIISRGQQVEIGGSFRIPDVIQKSGCKMVEVGTTNRTHLRDYANAINDNTGAILVAHTSNFKVIGFTKDVQLSELSELARKKRIPLLVDLGSGALAQLEKFDLPAEPLVSEILKQGADVVTFSGDKLLGGPQAGVICGKKTILRKIHKNPLYRALRCDKFTCALIEETLRTYYSPTEVNSQNLTMTLLKRTSRELLIQGTDILEQVSNKVISTHGICIIATHVEAGSGALPLEKIPSAALVFEKSPLKASELARKFRIASTAVIGYIHNRKFIIDLKAVQDHQFSDLALIISEVLG